MFVSPGHQRLTMATSAGILVSINFTNNEFSETVKL